MNSGYKLVLTRVALALLSCVAVYIYSDHSPMLLLKTQASMAPKVLLIDIANPTSSEQALLPSTTSLSPVIAQQLLIGHPDVTVLSSTTVIPAAAASAAASASAAAAVPTKKIMLMKRDPKGNKQAKASEGAAGAPKQMSVAEKEKV
jgi:hypothetical protein